MRPGRVFAVAPTHPYEDPKSRHSKRPAAFMMLAFALMVFRQLLALKTGSPVSPENSKKCAGTILDPIIVSVSTKMSGDLCRFLETASWHEIHPKILGWGREYTSHMVKMEEYLKELQNYRKDRIIILMDSDVLIQQGWDEIIPKYCALGQPRVLVSTECTCWPFMNFPELDKAEATCMRFNPQPESYSFPNTAFMMGKAGDLRELIDDILRNNPEKNNMYWPADDQEAVARLYLNHREQYGLSLDHKASIAMPVYEGCTGCKSNSALEVRESRLYNSYTKSTPAIMHLNGRNDFSKVFRHFKGIAKAKRAVTKGHDAWFHLGDELKYYWDFCREEYYT